MPAPIPDLSVERRLLAEGAPSVVGLDEVGRGAWAGPVSVGAVLWSDSCGTPPEGIRDSKLISPSKRRALEPKIQQWAEGWAVGSASHRECDLLGMRAAVALASSRALDALGVRVQAVIVDGPLDLLDAKGRAFEELVADHQWRREAPRVEAMVKADQRCVSVAAASVVAKVARDQEMALLAESFPAFGFDSNAGYPAPVHRRALFGYGLTSIHRRSWSFVDDLPLGGGDQ